MIWPHLNSLISSMGSKQLAVFEISQGTLRSKKLPVKTSWDSVSSPRNNLNFTGIQLAHAVVKADYLEYRNPTFPGLGFLLQSHHLIDWSASDLRLKQGATTLFSDFVLTSMIGRLGQGLTLLFSHSQGYSFTAHLASHLKATGIPITDSNGKLIPAADFVFDGPSGRAIVESKASCSVKENTPSKVKRKLKVALDDQVIPWMSKINPPANKSFVVASYLRESNSPSSDPSTLVFVDPDGAGEISEFDMSQETVARENYAAWLTAMGLVLEADRLRNPERAELNEVYFDIFEIGPREVAFPSTANFGGRWEGFPAGVDFVALKAVSEAAQGNGAALLPYRVDTELLATPSESFHYSIFPDGTFLGSLSGARYVRHERVLL